MYINLVKFKVLLYNLKCGVCDWWDFNLVSLEKSPNHQILILAKTSTDTVARVRNKRRERVSNFNDFAKRIA